MARDDHSGGMLHTKDNTVLMLSRGNMAQKKLRFDIFRKQTQAVARVRGGDSGAREEMVRDTACAIARFSGGTCAGKLAPATEAVGAAML